MLLNDIERRIKDSNTFWIQIPEGKKIPEHVDSDDSPFQNDHKNHG
jgi:hypothetical protein